MILMANHPALSNKAVERPGPGFDKTDKSKSKKIQNANVIENPGQGALKGR